jgi:hypothetical protein
MDSVIHIELLDVVEGSLLTIGEMPIIMPRRGAQHPCTPSGAR